MELLTRSLYKSVLLEPAFKGADTLNIVSGFASPAMASKHLDDLQEKDKDIAIRLIYGMSSQKGIEAVTHKAFVDLQKKGPNFKCYYSSSTIPTHAKVYTWLRNNKPVACYTGSANYSQRGFDQSKQLEAMTATNAVDGFKYYRSIFEHSRICDLAHIHLIGTEWHPSLDLAKVELSLLDTKTHETHKRSGLNWGQRANRDRNQAYIPVPADIARSDFFPKKKDYFSVLTDDDTSFTANIAQDSRKAIHTPESNAILGRYFRRRLGLEDGQFITRHHLESYGRTTVTFFKIDDEAYKMDFAAHRV